VCIIIITSYSHRQSQRSAFVGPLTSSCLLERPPARQKSSLLPHTSTHFESLDFDVSSGISCCLPGLPTAAPRHSTQTPSTLPSSPPLPYTALDLSWSRSRLTTFPSSISISVSIPISRPAAEPTAPHSGSYHETTALKGIRAHTHPSMSNRTQCG
jgi:hypothetical protein